MSETTPGATENTVLNASIFDFRNKIADLARPNLFQVELAFPAIVDDGDVGTGATPDSQEDVAQSDAGAATTGTVQAAELVTFLVKAANIPASTIGVIEVPYRGRTLKIAGDRTFEPWTITVLNDRDFALRAKFESWSTKIQNLQQNKQEPKSIGEYQASGTVKQLDRRQKHVRAYQFQGIWPSNISAIDLAWDSNDTVQEYTVEFQVQYWTYADNTNTGNAVPDVSANV
jgi:hypothetical protein